MAFKYLILDLDNTLYSENSGLLSAIDAKIDEYLLLKLKMTPEELVILRNQYYREYGTTLGGMMVHHQTDPEDYIRLTYDLDVNRYLGKDRRLEQTLKGIELPKIVFSNSPLEYIQRVLRVLGIEKLIDGIYDIRFCNYCGKPNPGSYREVLKDLRVSGEECIFVDDVRANVLGAQKAGMAAIWLAGSQDEIKWNIRQIYDLPACIEQISLAELTA